MGCVPLSGYAASNWEVGSESPGGRHRIGSGRGARGWERWDEGGGGGRRGEEGGGGGQYCDMRRAREDSYAQQPVYAEASNVMYLSSQ